MSKVVLFDFDGVLVDSEECHAKAAQQYMEKKFELHVPIEELIQLTGYTGLEKIDRLLNKHNVKHALSDINLEVIRALYAKLSQYLKPRQGVNKLILHLAKSGKRLGIVSSMFRIDINNFLFNNRLASYFESIIGYEDAQHKKPHPEPYLTAIKKFGSKNTFYVVEDSSNGIQSAKEAGIKNIIVFTQRSSINKATQFITVSSIATIANYIDNIT